MPRIFRFAFVFGLAHLATALNPHSVAAQSGPFVELYGEGVHHYFAGRVSEAQELLTRAIDGGSEDPRVYFFRGLTQQAMGGDGAADFEVGARYEAEGNRSVDVGAALVRIQGSARTAIEVARRDARIMVAQQRSSMGPGASDAMTLPGAGQPPVVIPTEPAQDDPFGENGGMRSNEAVEAVPSREAPAAEVEGAANPFGDEAEAPASGATEPVMPESSTADPFSSPSTEGATEAADPFGSNPFE